MAPARPADPAKATDPLTVFERKIGGKTFKFATASPLHRKKLGSGNQENLWLWDDKAKTWLRGWGGTTKEMYFSRSGSGKLVNLNFSTGTVNRSAEGAPSSFPPPKFKKEEKKQVVETFEKKIGPFTYRLASFDPMHKKEGLTGGNTKDLWIWDEIGQGWAQAHEHATDLMWFSKPKSKESLMLNLKDGTLMPAPFEPPKEGMAASVPEQIKNAF